MPCTSLSWFDDDLGGESRVMAQRQSCMFEAHVHKSVFEKGGESCSKPFWCNNTKWCLKLTLANGDLGLFLCSLNEFAVKVHYSVAVIDGSGQQNHLIDWDQSEFQPLSRCGFPRLVSLADLTAEEPGFVAFDEISIRLYMRLQLPENEELSLATEGSQTIIKWRLRHLNQLAPIFVSSDELTVGDLKLRIVFRTRPRTSHTYHARIEVDCITNSCQPVKCNLNAERCVPGHPCTPIDTLTSFRTTDRGRERHDFEIAHSFQGPASEDCYIILRLSHDLYGTLNSSQESSQQRECNYSHASSPQQSRCVICLEQKPEAAFVHGTLAHKCMCSKCVIDFEATGDRRCPACMLEFERILYRIIE